MASLAIRSFRPSTGQGLTKAQIECPVQEDAAHYGGGYLLDGLPRRVAGQCGLGERPGTSNTRASPSEGCKAGRRTHTKEDAKRDVSG